MLTAVACLTERIRNLREHMAKNKKDVHNKKGLHQMLVRVLSLTLMLRACHSPHESLGACPLTDAPAEAPSLPASHRLPCLSGVCSALACIYPAICLGISYRCCWSAIVQRVMLDFKISEEELYSVGVRCTFCAAAIRLPARSFAYSCRVAIACFPVGGVYLQKVRYREYQKSRYRSVP